MFKKLKHKIDVEYNKWSKDVSYDDFVPVFEDSLFCFLSTFFPSCIVGFIAGLVKKKKFDYCELKDDGLIFGLIKFIIYSFALEITIILTDSISPSSMPALMNFSKTFLILLVADNFLITSLTLPLFYLLGRDAKNGVSTIKKKSKKKKKILLEQKKELEKELAKDYLVSPEVMEYTNSNRRKEIEDYKNLREEYVPTVEVVPETQKVMELK